MQEQKNLKIPALLFLEKIENRRIQKDSESKKNQDRIYKSFDFQYLYKQNRYQQVYISKSEYKHQQPI